MMEPITMFLKEFELKTNTVITIDDIGYETVWLYKEEVDEAFIPSDVLETLDAVVVASSILFTDESGDEYMRLAVQDPLTLTYDKYVRWFINHTPLDWTF